MKLLSTLSEKQQTGQLQASKQIYMSAVEMLLKLIRDISIDEFLQQRINLHPECPITATGVVLVRCVDYVMQYYTTALRRDTIGTV
jgi:hypothetical protein